jgi:hypothetical protein
MQKIKARISKVKKNRPIFGGRYEVLPPLKKEGSIIEVVKTDLSVLMSTERNPAIKIEQAEN